MIVRIMYVIRKIKKTNVHNESRCKLWIIADMMCLASYVRTYTVGLDYQFERKKITGDLFQTLTLEVQYECKNAKMSGLITFRGNTVQG